MVVVKPLPELLNLRRIFDVDFETGILTWKARNDVPTNWNSKYAGTQAGGLNKKGYIQVKINAKLYFAHRVVWKLAYGVDPNNIDHKNGTKTDNKISNLRSVTNQENMKNAKLYNTNKSGVTGVFWSNKKEKWRAQIQFSGKKLHLGYFDDFAEAVTARKAAEIKHGFHQNHGRNA